MELELDRPIVLNFPGIGAGELERDKIESILNQFLTDQVTVVYK